MDGLIYSTLAHNLANSIGTFWFPSFSETIMNNFHEHPPLVFGIQSIFFRLLGDGFYVEKIYSTLTAILTAWFIILIWKKVSYSEKIRVLYWLPILLWITIPNCFWSYNNNMLENTMGLFSLAAIYCLLTSLNKHIRMQIFYFILAGLLLFFSFLSKGFTGLFPIAFFFCYYLIFRKSFGGKSMLINSLIMLIVLTGISVLFLYINEPARESLTKYINSQVLESLQGKRVVVPRWHIMIVLLREFLIIITITTILVFSYYKKSFFQIKKESKAICIFILFILIGLSASAPIMISPKQLGFYIVPSLPYYAIGFSMLIAHIVSKYLDRINQFSLGFRIFQYFGYSLIFLTILLSAINYGNYARDKVLIHDVILIGENIPEGSTITISKPLFQHWSLIGYFQRKFYINLDRSRKLHEYVLMKKNEPRLDGYIILEIGLKEFQLMKKHLLNE